MDPREIQQRIRQAAAKALEAAPSDVEVTLLEGVTLPGLTVFRARAASRGGRRGSYVFGVATKDRIELDQEQAIALVLRVLRRDATRPPDPMAVARAVGFLEGHAEPAYPILTEKDLGRVNDDWRPHMFLPRMVKVEGGHTIEYWNRAGGPAWRTRIMLRTDGTSERSVKPIGEFLPD